MRRREVVVGSALALSSGCLQLSQESSETPAGNGSGSATKSDRPATDSSTETESPTATPAQAIDESELLSRQWEGPRVSSFILDGDSVYTGGPVSKVTVDEGIRRWTALPDTGARHFGAEEGWLYTADRAAEGSVYRIDTERGSVDWRSEIPGTAGFISLTDDFVITAIGKELVALAKEDGSIRWRMSDSGDGGSISDTSPAYDGYVYVSSTQTPETHQVRTSDGTVVNTIEDSSGQRIMVDSNGVYLVSGLGLTAYSHDLSERQYRTDFEGTPRKASLAEGSVFVGTKQNVHRIDAESGSRRWQYDTGVTNLGSIHIGSDWVWLGTRSDLHAIAKETGDGNILGGFDSGMTTRNIVEHEGMLVLAHETLRGYRIMGSS